MSKSSRRLVAGSPEPQPQRKTTSLQQRPRSPSSSTQATSQGNDENDTGNKATQGNNNNGMSPAINPRRPFAASAARNTRAWEEPPASGQGALYRKLPENSENERRRKFSMDGDGNDRSRPSYGNHNSDNDEDVQGPASQRSETFAAGSNGSDLEVVTARSIVEIFCEDEEMAAMRWSDLATWQRQVEDALRKYRCEVENPQKKPHHERKKSLVKDPISNSKTKSSVDIMSCNNKDMATISQEEHFDVDTTSAFKSHQSSLKQVSISSSPKSPSIPASPSDFPTENIGTLPQYGDSGSGSSTPLKRPHTDMDSVESPNTSIKKPRVLGLEEAAKSPENLSHHQEGENATGEAADDTTAGSISDSPPVRATSTACKRVVNNNNNNNETTAKTTPQEQTREPPLEQQDKTDKVNGNTDNHNDQDKEWNKEEKKNNKKQQSNGTEKEEPPEKEEYERALQSIRENQEVILPDRISNFSIPMGQVDGAIAEMTTKLNALDTLRQGSRVKRQEVASAFAFVASLFGRRGFERAAAIIKEYLAVHSEFSTPEQRNNEPKFEEPKLERQYRTLMEKSKPIAGHRKFLQTQSLQINNLQGCMSVVKFRKFYEAMRDGWKGGEPWVKEGLEAMGLVPERNQKVSEKIYDYFTHCLHGESIEALQDCAKYGAKSTFPEDKAYLSTTKMYRKQTANTIRQGKFPLEISEILGDGIWIFMDKRRKDPFNDYKNQRSREILKAVAQAMKDMFPSIVIQSNHIAERIGARIYEGKPLEPNELYAWEAILDRRQRKYLTGDAYEKWSNKNRGLITSNIEDRSNADVTAMGGNGNNRSTGNTDDDIEEEEEEEEEGEDNDLKWKMNLIESQYKRTLKDASDDDTDEVIKEGDGGMPAITTIQTEISPIAS